MAIRDLWCPWARKCQSAAAQGKRLPNRPPRRWLADIYVLGRRIFKAFPKKSQVQAWISRQKTSEIEGELGIKPRLGFRALARRYLDEKRRQRRPSTFSHYLHIIRPHLVPYFDDTPIDKITREQIIAYISKRLGAKVKRGQHLVHPSTVNKEIAMLKRLFKYGKVNGYFLPDDPSAGITFMKAPPKKRVRFLSDEEVDRFLAACPPTAYGLYLTAVDTGMRRNELWHFSWHWIDWSRGVIRIKQDDKFQTKSHEEREVPMTTRLRDHLASLTGAPSGLVLASKPGAVSWDVKHHPGFRYHVTLFPKLVEQSGLEWFTLHDLRHTFASRLVMRGVDIFVVSKLLGHKDVKTTQLYAHLAPDHLREAIRRLDVPCQPMSWASDGGMSKLA